MPVFRDATIMSKDGSSTICVVNGTRQNTIQDVIDLVHNAGYDNVLSLSDSAGGTPLDLNNEVCYGDDPRYPCHNTYFDATTDPAETITGFYLDGTEYKFEGSEASGVTTEQPSNPVAGSTYYDTTNNVLMVYDGSAWSAVGGSDYSWETKTISSGQVELGLRTIVNHPGSNFTLTAPATLKEGEEYTLRVINEASYTMTLGTGFTNPRNVDLTLSQYATDQFAFLAVGGDLELQPLVATGS